jgi:acyl-coenzyme A synthetase/AMP-(fatty) acid ligase/predicted MFS family arabinose efflux permease
MTGQRTGFVALLAADVTSALGNRIAVVAIPWLVLVTTGDPAKMGLAAAAELVPYLLSGVFAAPVADRIGLRRTSILADVGSALTVAAIAALPGFPTLIGLIVATGTLRGVGDRAKHVLLRPMAEAAEFGMARVAAAYESLVRSAMMVGAPLGGLLILWFSARGAMVADAISFAACAALVIVFVRPAKPPRTESEPYLAALRGGARYLRRDRLLLLMITLIFVTNVFSQAEIAVFIPVWASNVLHSPAALGALLGTLSAGGVLGSVVFTALVGKLPRYAPFLVGVVIADAPVLLILLSHNLPVVLVVLFIAGVGVSMLNPILGALQYERIPPDLQNRVFGLVTAACYAGLPIGGVLGGLAVAGLGLDAALLLAGLLCLGFILTLVVRARGEWESKMPHNYVPRMLELFAQHGDREALRAGDRSMSYVELRASVLDLSAALRSHGIRPGMSVAVLIELPIEGPALQLALHHLGCRVVWILDGAGRKETRDYLDLTKPDVFLYDPRTSDTVELATKLLDYLGALPVLCLGPGGSGPDLLAFSPQETYEHAEGEPESVFQTSGTTGTPKAILHRDGMFRQAVVLAQDWAAADHPRLRHLSYSPLWWSAGTVATMITLGSGGLIVLEVDWTPGGFADTIQRHEINFAFVAPAMLYEVLDDPNLDPAKLSSMYMLNVGGAPTAPNRLRQAIETFGPVLRNTYGLSESPYVAAFTGIDAPRLGSCGRPYGDVQVEIRAEDGTVLEPGVTGELWVQSRLNFAGYLGQPELTEETIVDGWVRTRDLGYRDAEGYLYLAGRAQDMIVTGMGARKIFARPIEDVLSTHPDVQAAAVIGVPDDALVEVVHAYVVPKPGAKPDLEELCAHVTDQLASICAPRTVDFVDSLPVIGFGKVDKKALREQYTKEHRPRYVVRALDAFARFGDREAIVGVGWDCRLTYHQCRAMVLDMAARLRDAGFRPGMTVAVMVAHPPEAPLLQLALHLLGCRTAWIAAGTSRPEVDEYLQLIGPELFIYDTRTHAKLGRELGTDLGLPVLCLGPDGLGEDLLAPAANHVEPFDLNTVTGEPETIFQTSGTTGRPKPIHHTAALYEQMYALSEDWVATGQPLLRHMSLTPMWYVAGQISAVLNLFTGGVLFVLYRFEPGEYLATIEQNRVNSVFISPLMFSELLDHPAIETTDCSSMELLSIGGAAVTPARLRQGVARFGPVIRITYGLSETPWISAFPGINEDPVHPDRIRSCGTPYGDVRTEIRDEDGKALGPGEVGELWVASKLNFAGYWGRPDLTEQTMIDGWLRTKDLAYADEDGYLHLVGRAQDLIITGIGCDHIFPRPIEDALATHPQVRAAAVIGVPDPEVSESAFAYVVTTEGATVTADELSTLVAERLGRSWAPRGIEFVADLPRTSSGKASIKELKAKWAAEHQDAVIGALG